MRNKFTILRNMAAAPTTDPFSGGILAGIAEAPEVVARPKVESAELSMQEVLEASRDPTVVGIAPAMPTKMIQLVEDEADTQVPATAQAQTAWGIKAVRADVSSFTGNGVVVSILDTGIDKNHPAFQGVQLIEKDFSGAGNGDGQGHGTHCAGTVFGRDVNGNRIGVARGVQKALIGKVLDNQGNGDSDMLFRGMQWAQQEGANIISMSLGFDFPGFVDRLINDQGLPAPAATSIALEGYRANLRMFDAIMNLYRQSGAFGPGLLVVAASGNESNRDGNPAPVYEVAVSVPAAAQDVIAVGAIADGQNGFSVAPFSNTFPQVSAPGVNILSAKAGGGLVAFNGTSMATPHVAGVAALWWEKRKAAANNRVSDAVRADLIASARDNVFAAGTDAADRGFGLVTSPA
ncbi:MAG TPA: S8 family serine peptidase [Sphingomicrobium sp.]|nr:S8 family serine peptidase [Sphingomicrobium sp.]